jgi:radical SAM protein with 4Fe4S-binding SPASM domain
VVVQMVRMERNAGEVDNFMSFWSAVPGIDQIRIKEDETNLMRPDARHEAKERKHPCHLWRGPLYVKHSGHVYPCCQSYMLGGETVGRVGEQPLEEIWNGETMQNMRRLHAAGREGEIDVCSRCRTRIPHPALVVGSLILHGKTVRRLLPIVERLVYFSKLPKALLNPSRLVATPEFVQTSAGKQLEKTPTAD